MKCRDSCHICFSLFNNNSPRYVVAKVNYNLYRVYAGSNSPVVALINII